jgi:hypothetical protein
MPRGTTVQRCVSRRRPYRWRLRRWICGIGGVIEKALHRILKYARFAFWPVIAHAAMLCIAVCLMLGETQTTAAQTEPAETKSQAPAAKEAAAPPKAPAEQQKFRRRHRIADRVLGIAMSKPGLQRPRMVARIRQRIAAVIAQHVRMDRERHLGPSADPAKERVERLRRHRPVPLGQDHMLDL